MEALLAFGRLLREPGVEDSDQLEAEENLDPGKHHARFLENEGTVR